MLKTINIKWIIKIKTQLKIEKQSAKIIRRVRLFT